MLFIIGLIVVFGCVAGGYAMHHGNFSVLWQPNEVVIIFGAAMGATIISNPGFVLKGMLKGIVGIMKGVPHKKNEYIDLLMFIYGISKFIKMKGMLEVESALDNPEESELFTKYPNFTKNHHAVEFFADYMRLVVMGMDNHIQLDESMDSEIEAHNHELETFATAVNTMADGLPALGIVAAVLGIIQTMGSITEPPEILGGLIGAALVGTFLGILMGYGVVGPIAASMAKNAMARVEYFYVIKGAILAHVQGNPPAVTAEFSRKLVPEHLRPSFKELDDMINESSS